MQGREAPRNGRVRSFFGMILVLLVFVMVVGGSGLIWYLSRTAEFSRVDRPPAGENR